MFGVGSIPWSPLARGLVTRPLSDQSKRGETDWFIGRYKKGSTSDIINRFVLHCCWVSLILTIYEHCRIEEIAKKRGISMAQVNIAWILSKEGVSAPIVGTTNLDNLKDIVAGVNVKLTDEELKYLEEPYQPLAIVGHV